MRFVKLLLLVVLAVLALAACGGDSAEPVIITETVQVEVTRVTTETQVETVVETVIETVTERVVETVSVMALPAIDPLSVRGDIITAGSSTVFPLTERMVERFQREGYSGRITIDSIGSGAGFSRFCVAGESDISNASRPIRESEIESCRAIGREPIEFRVGTDALAVVVSAANNFVTDVTMEELNLIFGTAATWSDVRSEWPNQPILRFIPGTDSGTFDYFVEEVFDSNEEDILAASNLQLSEDDNVLVQGIQGSPYAIGFFGYAYYEENRSTLTILDINGVEPTDETVEDATYPLARPLFIYSTATIMQAKPQVAAFINFYLSYVQEEVVSVGYFPASTAALNNARERWLTGNLMAIERPAVSGIILPSVDPLAVTGDIITAGSSTVFPLTERMVERFQREGYSGRITIDSIGSGAGFSRFCVAGESDISNASRPIRESEIESCRAIGRDPIEFRVGTDALAVVVSSANDFVTDVTMDELNLIFGTAANWSDVRAEWPNQPILRFIPGTDSGTFDYFVEEVFDSNEEDILGASNLQLSEDDNVLVQGVQGSPFAVGFFGYAYYEENRGTLTILDINGVEPTDQTVEDATYPLARPLFIYSTATIMEAKPQVAAFINFYLSYVQEEVVSVGYFPASEDALNLAKFYWINANN
jgi:phosphate transport system substrate-binding protein